MATDGEGEVWVDEKQDGIKDLESASMTWLPPFVTLPV